MDEQSINGEETLRPGWGRKTGVTLILIPLIIVIIWLLENYLLAGSSRLFLQANLPGLVLYTILSGIVVGILVPIVRIRAAFLSGAVNMFQIGFRSLRRTVAAVSMTALAGYAGVVLMSLWGQGFDRWTGAALFLFLLPTAIAAVMICWMLVGTHVQAYVRSGGVVISVVTGVLLTAMIFAIAMTALFAAADFRGQFAGFFALGCVSALFFFAVRDIWATILVVTAGLVILQYSRIDPAYIVPLSPVVALCGLLTAGVLAGVHWYFSRNYTTVVLPGK